jgi:flavin-dependent dehydrogenase
VDHFQVALIDKLKEPKDRIGESLAPAAQRIFRELNLLQKLDDETQGKLYRKNLGMQSYWGSDQVHIVDHLRNPDGLGLNLDRKAFEVYLREVTKERGVQCLWSSKLHSSEYVDQQWIVSVKSDDSDFTIESNFVIDATGRQSHFARSQGIERVAYDKLIACWMSLSNVSENRMSTISASKNGWWYSAVVPNEKRVIAFQTDADIYDKSQFKSLDSFLELSKENPHITEILDSSDLSSLQFHGVTAANSTKLNQVAGTQWVAIGDAAISFDPLSSQGMFNAMACAMQLKHLILEYGFGNEMSEHYSNQIQSIWQSYLQHKDIFYEQEQRWKESEFWKRRHLVNEYRFR